MRKIGIIAMAIAFVLSLAACNTVRGFGQDVSAGGRAIGSAATTVQDHL